MAVNRRPRYYFSFRSPYSWLAHLDLRDRHPLLAAALDWIPFWEPDARISAELSAAGGAFVYRTMSREKHRYILQDVRRLTRQRGLSLRWPVDRAPRWEVSHLPYFVAARHGRAWEFVDAVFRARWLSGADISDPATIRVVAGEVGLDADQVVGAVDDPAVRAQAVDALLAIERDGVFGVPFFAAGYDKYWGLDRLDAFVARLAAPASAAARPAPEPFGGPAGELDHPGGCG